MLTIQHILESGYEECPTLKQAMGGDRIFTKSEEMNGKVVVYNIQYWYHSRYNDINRPHFNAFTFECMFADPPGPQYRVKVDYIENTDISCVQIEQSLYIKLIG